jgi:23S rRNA (adenine2503-C2)-methyltransferase
MDKNLIYDVDLPDLKGLLKSWGEPSYRADQVWKGIYQQFWENHEDFSNLPKRLRDRLFDHFSFSYLTPSITKKSSDGETLKILFNLQDGLPIETVKMRYVKRRTLCISTQSGCAMGCVFCATGQMGYLRNLSSGEIIQQILYFAKFLKTTGERVSNVVFMGMGEPFHNYANVLDAIKRLNRPDGMNLGARRFTISTVGLIPGIKKFTEENLQVNLAVSLHAVDDKLRSTMMPINKKYPIAPLLTSLRQYSETTKRRVTFEWALIKGVNDTKEQAHKLSTLLKGIIAHVNLIPLNPTDGFEGKATDQKQATEFKGILDKHGVSCTIRLRRGIDIQAGCGQLANK